MSQSCFINSIFSFWNISSCISVCVYSTIIYWDIAHFTNKIFDKFGKLSHLVKRTMNQKISTSNIQKYNDFFDISIYILSFRKSLFDVNLFSRHLVKINKCRLWGPWEVEWTIELDDILSMPQIIDAEMILTLRPVIYFFSFKSNWDYFATTFSNIYWT